MLYVTTRSNADVFTAHRVLTEARAGDGGQFVPFRMPVFSEAEIAALKEEPFNDCLARMLNLMFGTKLTRWDLDFAVGRYPIRVTELGHRILMGECWHNPAGNYARTESGLLSLLGVEEWPVHGDWRQIAVRIAVFFGLYGELLRSGVIEPGEKIDISAVSAEFVTPISAWYARKWGLPIGNIILCCNENSEIWNLICHGQLRTDVLGISTSTPEADVTLPVCLERLIHGCGGPEETIRYLEICRRGGMYVPGDRLLPSLRDGLFVSVISSHRIESTVPGAFATHRYLMSPYTALAYAGLLDYRAKKGVLRHSVVIADRNPLVDGAMVAAKLGIPEKELKNYL